MTSPTLFCDNCGAANQSQAVYCRSCGYSLQAVKPTIYHSQTGQLLAHALLKQRYRIIAPIGSGGMGAVYQAEDTQLGDRKVAIKEMRQSGLSPQEQKEAANAFRQEAIMLAHLQHRNLPSIFDHFEENGRWYLVMSFIEGETLADYLGHTQGGKLRLDEALQIGIQLCTVLGYLHDQHPAIIFRDLKPTNIMCASDGHLYLIDFGIARHFKPGQAKDTAYYGSMGYAPPEQYGKAQTTPRSDIYSLGVVLYQLLSGHNPSTTPFQFPPLRSQAPTVPMELAMLITHMLELDENKRPTSVLIVSQKLQNLTTSPLGILPTPPLQPPMGTGTPPISPPVLPQTGSRREVRRLMLLVGMVGIIILGSTLVYFATSYRVSVISNPNQVLPTAASSILTMTPRVPTSAPNSFSGTLDDSYGHHSVKLETNSATPRFQGVWYAIISDTEDSINVHGLSFYIDNVPSEINSIFLRQLLQKYPDTNTVIWFHGDSYHIPSSNNPILLGCDYYLSKVDNSSWKGLVFFPGSEQADGTIHLQ